MYTDGPTPPPTGEIIEEIVVVETTPSAPPTVPGAYRVSADPNEVVDPAHVHLSPQSIWPITMAFGIALAGLGLVSLIQLVPVGVLLIIISIIFWVQELRHEYS